MKYLIAGLGNIGDKYKNTRHNIGFKIVDYIAANNSVEFADKRYAFRTEFKYKSRNIILIKPTTYMNLSGNAIRYWLNKEKVDLNHLLVVTDDISLPFGLLRLKSKGGDAGHNGMSHIIEVLGTNEFPRLRVGIGNDFPRGRQVEYVLGNWTEEEMKILPEKIAKCEEIIKSFVTIGLDRTMNLYNNK
ncbi:MAG: aminoacyl-tRNA hydrolase [Marinilabiliales bacterium]